MSNNNGAKGANFQAAISDNSATTAFPTPRGLERKLVSPREWSLGLPYSFERLFLLTEILHFNRHSSRQHRARLGPP